MAALADVAQLIMGQSPPSSSYNDTGLGLPFFQGKVDFGFLYPTPRKYCTGPKKVAEDGDILISVRAPVGPTNICSTRSCIGRGLAAIRPFSISGMFLYYNLNYIEEEIASLGTGSTFKSINKSQLSSVEVNEHGFHLSEQRRIAAVLSLVQRAIEQQERLIVLTTELKKTLMHKLFTEGTRGEPQKQTEIGPIPESWEVVELGDICERMSEGYNPQANGKMPYVGLEHIVPIRSRLFNWGFEDEIRSSKSQFRKGDVLYGKLRPYLDKAVLAPFEGICSTDILVFKGKNQVENGFLIHLLHTENFIGFAKSTTTGVQHPRTSWNSLKKLKIALPKLGERTEIARFLDTLEDKIGILEKMKETSSALFRTLLHQLMTAEIRVYELDLAELGIEADEEQAEAI